MNERIVAALSRRASLLTLGAAGTAAAMAPLTANAKNKNKNKKIKKKARQKCQQQVEQCSDFVVAQCDSNDECIADGLICCDFLDDCNFTGFLGCLA